jgi:hypothetical protein
LLLRIGVRASSDPGHSLHAFYNPDAEIDAEVLVDLNSGNVERGICALPYQRVRDGAETYFPVNIIGNLYVSNGMAAGNTLTEARRRWPSATKMRSSEAATGSTTSRTSRRRAHSSLWRQICWKTRDCALARRFGCLP